MQTSDGEKVECTLCDVENPYRGDPKSSGNYEHYRACHQSTYQATYQHRGDVRVQLHRNPDGRFPCHFCPGQTWKGVKCISAHVNQCGMSEE